MSTTTLKEFAIVKAIMSVLKLDDAGKISNFFAQEVKSAKEAIDGLKLNIQVAELKRKQAVSKSSRAIEDAEDKVEAAYQGVTPEDVASNAKMSTFSTNYWDSVKGAENDLEYLKDVAKDVTDNHVDAVKSLNEKIAKYEARIARIGKKA